MNLDNKIDKLLTRQQKINTFVINKIAKRVKDIGELLPSDIMSLKQLQLNSQDIQEITEQIAIISNKQFTDIKQLIEDIAISMYVNSEDMYIFRHMDIIPFEKNEHLQRVVKAVQNQTLGEYSNLSKAQAFMIRNRKTNTFTPTSIAKTYQEVIDTAIQSTQSGVTDYQTSMRNVLKQLNDSGIKMISYDTPSGRPYVQSAEAAVRRNILDGVRAINQGVQNEIGKQINANGKEITVHLNCAPDHEPVQGHQFTNEEFNKLQSGESFQDVNGQEFAPIERAIGTLNCRHFTYSIIVGLNPPNYTSEQLNAMIENNHKGYTLTNGKHLTLYECSQMQRQYERNIRKMKTGEKMAKEAGDEKLEQYYVNKKNKLLKEYQKFSNLCGLRMKQNRLVI